MSSSPLPPLAVRVRPTTRTYKIVDLMTDVGGGKIRIPPFQRAYRWTAYDRLLLLDSLWKGYPAGLLLLWRRAGPAGEVALGPLRLSVEEDERALWVVDGQQRIASLAASFLVTPSDPAFRSFAAWFDLDKQEFVGHSASGRTGGRWLPIHRALDPNELQEWAIDNVSRDAERRRLAFAVGSALRDAEFPAIIVESNDQTELRQIFDRVNTAGRRLKRAEVFRALHEGLQGDSPDSVATVAREVAELGRGNLGPTWIQRTAEVLAGIDPTTRARRTKDRTPGAHANILAKTVDPLRRTADFLVEDAGIARIELVPNYRVIPILARVFERWPDPHERNRGLLVRWVWRGAITGAHASSSSPMFRKMIRAANADTESDAVQQLLEMVPRETPSEWPDPLVSLRRLHARARIALVAFLSTGVQPLEDDQVRDLIRLTSFLDEPGDDEPLAEDPSRAFAKAFRELPVLTPRKSTNRTPAEPDRDGVANLLFTTQSLPGTSPLEWLKEKAESHSEALATHGFTEDVIAELLSDAPAETLVKRRGEKLSARALDFWARMAQFDHPDRDRPPLSAVLDSVDDEADEDASP